VKVTSVMDTIADATTTEDGTMAVGFRGN